MVAAGRLPDPGARSRFDVGGHALHDVLEQRLPGSPVRLEGDQHRNLVPDELESLGVVGHLVAEERAVRDVDEASRRLFRVDPVADLGDREAEETDVEHVSFRAADLDAVTDLERAADDDVDPAGHVLEDVCQRDGETGRHHSEIGGEVVDRIQPDPRQGETDDDRRRIRRELARPVDDLVVVCRSLNCADRERSDENRERQDDERREQLPLNRGADPELFCDPIHVACSWCSWATGARGMES